jgi:integrase
MPYHQGISPLRARQSKTFTELYLDSLKFNGDITYYWDKHLPAFGVRVTKSKKVFTVIRGKKRERITIGEYPALSLKAARREAMGLLAKPGRTTDTIGLKDALDTFIALHCAKLKGGPQMEWTLRKHLTTDISLHRIDRAYVQTLLDGLQDAPGAANHLFQYFRTFMFWCVSRGHLEHYPLTGMSLPHKPGSRTRVLSDEELLQIWQHLGDDTFSRTVKLLILTGCRRSEIQNLILEGDTAILPAKHSKNGVEHVFPLPSLAIPLMGDLTFNGWSKAKAKLDAGLPEDFTPWTLHDLRRTYSTIHARLGTPLHVTERLLNHLTGTVSGVAAIYNRHTYAAEMRQAVDNFERHIQSLIARA